MKINYNGIKLRVRRLSEGETIKHGNLYRNIYPGGSYYLERKFFQTLSAGDKVAEHPNREYYEVLSKFYHPNEEIEQ